MLVTFTYPAGVAYRVDCDGCGLKDEHDRGPNGEIMLWHDEEADAYASAACTECENGPGFTHTAEGKDLCRTCASQASRGAIVDKKSPVWPSGSPQDD